MDSWALFTRIKQVQEISEDAFYIALDMTWDLLEKKQDRETTIRRLGVLVDDPAEVLERIGL